MCIRDSSWGRIILAKTLTNIQNVLLGALWSSILYSKGYWYYLTTSAIKNVLYLPLQIVLLALVLRYLLPVLYQQGLTPKQLNGNRIFSRRG